MPYFEEPVGKVKIQITSKNAQRYDTPKLLISFFIIEYAKLLFQCRRILRIFIYRECMREVCEAERNSRVVVLLFLYSSINDETSLSSNCYSSFDLSNKLGSIFASQSDSSSSEKWFKLSTIFFLQLHSHPSLARCEKACLTGSLEYKYRVIFVLAYGVICTLLSVVG